MTGTPEPVFDLATKSDGTPKGLVLAQPVNAADGKVVGVCALFLDLNWFSNIFEGIRLPDNAQACLLDGQARVLATWPSHPDRLGHYARDVQTIPPEREKRGETIWTANPATEDPSYNVAVAVPTSGRLGLRLRLRLPLQAVFAPLDEAMTNRPSSK